MAALLSHDEVEMLLRELAGRQHTDGVTAGNRIVGGAAIALMKRRPAVLGRHRRGAAARRPGVRRGGHDGG